LLLFLKAGVLTMFPVFAGKLFSFIYASSSLDFFILIFYLFGSSRGWPIIGYGYPNFSY
jgi:hypothetical protein